MLTMPGVNFPVSMNARELVSSSSCIQMDPKKLSRLQGHLLLIIHSHNCLQRERESDSWRAQCRFAGHCKLMKKALNHMKTCEKDNSCRELACGASRKLMKHWKNCKNSCSFCAGIKNILEQRKQYAKAKAEEAASSAPKSDPIR